MRLHVTILCTLALAISATARLQQGISRRWEQQHHEEDHHHLPFLQHPHHGWRHHVEGLSDGKRTSINIEICNMHRGIAPPPGPPNCSSGSSSSSPNPVCETHQVQPGTCHNGVAVSCWSFPSCISKQVYTTSSSCTGPMSSTVTPCTSTFNPVDEGCQFFHCNATSYYHRQCFHDQPSPPSDDDEEEVKVSRIQPENGLPDAVAKFAASLSSSSAQNQQQPVVTEGEEEQRGLGWSKKHFRRDEERYYRGFEKNCTKNFQCHDGPVHEYGKCEEAGPISFESLYLKRSPEAPFAQCGFLTFTVFEDPWCKGRPVSEFVTPSGACIGPQRLFGRDLWGSVRATCKSSPKNDN